jgi:2-succinyl-6-hydroxy-2,4-cyclohexadiene-1-carboxylate synthase
MITWLHGLFGAPTDFGAAALRVADTCPDRHAAMALPGHAGSPPLDPGATSAFDEVVAGLIATLDQLGVEQTALVGYSMGARVAMHVALAHPERVSRLAVIGGHPGIDDPQARAGRLMLDRKRAALVQGGGLRAFLATWYAQPLFAPFKASPHFEGTFQARCAGDAAAVATTLERLSLGHQAPLGEAMAACPVPTLWVAGALDTRYVGCLQPLAEAQPSGRFVAIPDTGHAVPSEAPSALARELVAFLNGSSETASPR